MDLFTSYSCNDGQTTVSIDCKITQRAVFCNVSHINKTAQTPNIPHEVLILT